MNTPNKQAELSKDIEYLEKQFPKGETKFRGQAMVLLALARIEGKAELMKELEGSEPYATGFRDAKAQAISEFNEKLKKNYFSGLNKKELFAMIEKTSQEIK